MNFGELKQAVLDAALARAAAIRKAQEPIPIGAVIQKLRVSSVVALRLRRFQPNGIRFGDRLRGRFLKPRITRAFHLDVMGPREFIRRYGRANYRKHRDLFQTVRGYGRQKAITGIDLMRIDLRNP